MVVKSFMADHKILFEKIVPLHSNTDMGGWPFPGANKIALPLSINDSCPPILSDLCSLSPSS